MARRQAGVSGALISPQPARLGSAAEAAGNAGMGPNLWSEVPPDGPEDNATLLMQLEQFETVRRQTPYLSPEAGRLDNLIQGIRLRLEARGVLPPVTGEVPIGNFLQRTVNGG